MKRRQPAGTVLSIVFLVTFALIIIGTAFFFIAKVLGGSRELNNAADAGALNVAKFAITNPAVNVYNPLAPGLPVDAQDFFALADQPGSNGATCAISSLTYNRTVAQALFVATNAQVEGTAQALQNANREVLAAKAVGNALQNAFGTSATTQALNSAFDGIKNNLKMMGEGEQPVVINPDGVTRVQSAFIKTGGSANVWFDPSVLSLPAPGVEPFSYYQIPRNNSPQAVKPRKLPDGNYQSAFSEVPGGYNALHLAGYTRIPVLQNTPYADNMFAVPNEPLLSPHLVSLGDFNAAASVFPDASVPQNAFRIDCHAFDKSTKGAIDTTACAMIGCTNAPFPVPKNSGVYSPGNSLNYTDYVAAIPAGYIRIVNLPDMNTNIVTQGLPLPPVENALYDGLHYIFNTKGDGGNHLASDAGGGAYVSKTLVYTNNPKSGFFVTLKDGGRSVLVKWAAYVNSHGTDGLGHDEALDPIRNTLPPHQGITPLVYNQNANQPPPGYLIHTGSGSGQLATLQQVLFSPGIRNSQSFLLNSATVDTAPLWVTEQLDAILANFGSSIEKVVGAKDYPTIVEYLKALIQQKLYYAADQKSFHFTLTIPANLGRIAPTGLKYFKHYDQAGRLIHYASPDWWHGAPTPHPTYPLFGNDSDNTPHSPMDLIHEINATAHKRAKPNLGDPNYNNFISLLTQRCKQMNPAITSEDVATALSSYPLGMSNAPEKLYLHLDLKSPTPKLVLTPDLLDNQGHSYDTGVGPDSWDPSNANAQYPSYTAEYSINGNIVDTQIDGAGTALRGDMNLEDRPYQNVSAVNGKGKKINPNQALTAVDGVVFYPSSGYNNLLGEVHFFQTPGTPPGPPPVTVTWSQPN
jgi:hypothetical protein